MRSPGFIAVFRYRGNIPFLWENLWQNGNVGIFDKKWEFPKNPPKQAFCCLKEEKKGVVGGKSTSNTKHTRSRAENKYRG